MAPAVSPTTRATSASAVAFRSRFQNPRRPARNATAAPARPKYAAHRRTVKAVGSDPLIRYTDPDRLKSSSPIAAMPMASNDRITPPPQYTYWNVIPKLKPAAPLLAHQA